ncbi:MAG: hypothetical protein QG650_132 [Patescibacteria group bacterium]|nr:hypothetical protein [Patescibacteria group bacterium]
MWWDSERTEKEKRPEAAHRDLENFRMFGIIPPWKTVFSAF